MSTGTQLIRAVLAEHCRTAAGALAVIEAALIEEVDPLEWCVHRYGISWPLAIERAARWAGMASFPTVPTLARGYVSPGRIASLGEVRFLRAHLLGREIGFVAPRFEHLLSLVAASRTRPGILANLCLVPPPALTAALVEACSDELMDEARQRLFRRWPTASASIELTFRVRLCFVMALAFLAVLLVAPLPVLQPLSFALLALLVIAPAGLRLLAVLTARPPPSTDALLEDPELPVYSVMVPLRDEASMVEQLARGLGELDYPREKLQVLFVVEERSASTVAAVRAFLEDPRFQLVIVPDGPPRTKPKALNFALPLVRGDFIVVYDAEDIPDRDQLRRAATRFVADAGVDCLQAELTIDNAGETALTALFAGEYAGQFGVMLPRLADWGLPMPLGGTSNHFRMEALKALRGWDSYNVTEDADLGIRLARLRHRTGVLDSQTREEAPLSLAPWLAQRTRWMKGWMQTIIVHNRHPRAFIRDIGWRGFVFVQIYVGGLILAPLLHTAFVAGWLGRLLIGQPMAFDGWLPAVIAVGYAGSFAIVITGLVQQRRWSLLPTQALLPLYWLLHSVATVRAAIDLMVRPFHWHKTAHGRTRVTRDAQTVTPHGDHNPVDLAGGEPALRSAAARTSR